MFSLRKPVATTVAPTVTLRVTAPHHGALVADLQSRMPHIAFDLAPALESQQQDADDQRAAVDEVEKTIAEYDQDHPHTGPLHVYLLDGKGVAGMDDASASALRALMHSAINSPTRTVAALMPEDRTVSKKEDLSMATMLRQLADSVLSTEGVTLLVGQAALETFLENPSAGNFKQAKDGQLNTTATESLVGVAVIGGLITEMPAMEGAGFEIALTVGTLTAASLLVQGVNAGIRKLGSLLKSRRKKDYPVIKQEAETLVTAIKRTYLNGAWLDKQVALTTLVSAQGIAEHLVKKSTLPPDLPQAVREHITTVKHWSEHFRSQVTPYMTKVAAIGTELQAKGKSDPVSASKWAAGELAKLKKPWAKIGIATDRLLGNPKFSYMVLPGGSVENDLHFEGLPEGIDLTVLPPLSKVKIPNMADLAVEAFNALTVLNLMERSLPRIPSGDDGSFSHELWDAMEDALILEYFWHSDHEREYQFMLWELQQSLLGISGALTKYMGRSLKNGKDSPL